MALSGTIYGTTSNEYIECKIVWSATQSIVNNTSTITAILYYSRTNTGYTTKGNYRGGITINGKTVEDTVSKDIAIGYQSNTEAFRATVVVPHNTDGTKSITISATGKINGTSLDSTSIRGNVSLTQIERRATLTAAPNFNDEANPTITYANPAGSVVSSLQACISLDKVADTIAYRDVSKTGTSYTFTLTDAERKTLRAATKNSNSMTVYFYLKTVIADQTYYSSLAKTYSIVNANPTLSPVVVDIDAATLALTGNSNTLIKYYSDASIKAGVAAKKEATISSVGVVCGNKSLTIANGTIQNVESGTFNFTAVDSRGNTTTQTLTKNFINYVKLTCNITPSMPTTDGTMTLSISGNYYNGSFGSVSNTLTLQYRMKTDDGSYSAWMAATPTYKNNTYTASVKITGLDYRSKYSFQARAVDKLITINSAEKSVRTTPVFDWSKEDFNFNVPVSFNAGMKTYNNVLWSGQNYMNASQTAYLASPVSKQTNGIVLVFSNYDTSTGVGIANDYDWHCYFVPKKIVELKGGTGHCFNMMSQAFGDIASKYLYIADTTISGHDVNTTNGTKNGITYNNAKYVMRYVFGV